MYVLSIIVCMCACVWLEEGGGGMRRGKENEGRERGGEGEWRGGEGSGG